VYERFFSLRERPFALSPDPDYLYRSRVHTEALSYLRYGIEGHAGFIVITGEIGSGKTTLLQTAMRGVDKHTAVSRVVNTQLDARDLIEAVMLDFGLSPEPGLSKPRLLRVLAEYLVQQRVAGRLALLVIDEAQNLSLAALEEVRMLSNLETEKSKLIQIALVGQPELRALMARPELEQLRQRVTVSYHLPGLDVDETAAYINHRLARAANGAPVEFGRDLTDVIHEFSRGVPRRINIIADAILLYAYGEGQKTIDLDLALKAIDELKASGILTVDAPAVVATPAVAPAAAPLFAPTGDVSAPVASADLIARQERVLAALQRLLAEQNHLIQEHREHLAALIVRASRVPTTQGVVAAPAPAPARVPAPAAATPPGAIAAPLSVAAAAAPAAAASAAAPALAASSPPVLKPPAPWPSTSSQRIIAPAPGSAPDGEGFWTRLGRGFFNTFSPAYKD
jgi:putative secretion ATPase (PEP-CTERM system associated)